MIPEIRNHSCHKRIQDLDLISLVQRRLWRQLIEVFKYLNEFTSASARGLFNYDLNDRTRNNGAKLIVKHFTTSVAQHFYPINIKQDSQNYPDQWTLSRTAWTNTGQKIPQMSVWTGSNHRCRAHFKAGCTNSRIQFFAGNGPNSLSYYYNYYYSLLPIIVFLWKQEVIRLLICAHCLIRNCTKYSCTPML